MKRTSAVFWRHSSGILVEEPLSGASSLGQLSRCLMCRVILHWRKRYEEGAF
jgi:hypothetical protein